MAVDIMRRRRALRAPNTGFRPGNGAAVGARGRAHSSRRRILPSLWLISPGIAAIALIYIVPTLANVFYSFTDFSTYSSGIHFVGLSNYTESVRTGGLGDSLRVTLVLAVFVVVGQNCLGLALAAAFSRPNRLSHLARSLLLAPMLIAPLASGYIWRAVFAVDGPVNTILTALMGHKVETQWLANPRYALGIIIWASIWRGVGLTVLLYVSALGSVPRSVRDAAVLDGASRARLFRSVTFPLILPAVLVNVILSLVGGLYSFDIVQAVTMGGPGQATTVLNVLTYKTFGFGQYGSAAAMSMALYACVAVLVVPLIIVARRREVQM